MLFLLSLYILWTLVIVGFIIQIIHYTRSHAYFTQQTRVRQRTALRSGLMGAGGFCLAIALSVDNFSDQKMQLLIAGQSTAVALVAFRMSSKPKVIFKLERFVMCLVLSGLAVWAALHGLGIIQHDLAKIIFS